MQMKPGFTCSIRFTADVGPLVQDSWTIVPLSAVFGESEGNKMYVWVVEDNKVHQTGSDRQRPDRRSTGAHLGRFETR